MQLIVVSPASLHQHANDPDGAPQEALGLIFLHQHILHDFSCEALVAAARENMLSP